MRFKETSSFAMDIILPIFYRNSSYFKEIHIKFSSETTVKFIALYYFNKYYKSEKKKNRERN